MKIFSFVLPLVIYILAELFFGVYIALGLSLLIPVGNIVYSLVRGNGWSVSSLADIGIIVVFALVEMMPYKYCVCFLLFGILLLLSSLKIIDIFKLAGKTDIIDLSNPYMLYNVRKSQLRMGLWCLIGSLVYFLKEVIWQDGPVGEWIDEWWLLTLLLAYVATEIIAGRINRYKYKNSEWVPLMATDGKVVGACPRPLVHNGSMWLHPVVHLHVVHNGKILLQLRPKSKKIQPGKWDTAVGGHIAAGEKLEDALKREVWEEIGLSNFEAKLVKQYVWECPVEHEFVFSFVTDAEGPFVTKNVGEVDELRFWSSGELSENIGKGLFTPNLEHELTDWILPMMKR
ncbi:MAG: NUDIX domain-containing protein [Bacteroidales bacterium]|nr:NUDIX domain-containing protein [Bacteroidales bacterium]